MGNNCLQKDMEKSQGLVISVVMPVYNAEKYLEESLGSLQRQMFPNFEVICVDDGSSDGSVNILEKFARQDYRFKYLRQAHQTAGAARNKGIDQATGKYIIFLDADDIFLPSMLQELYVQVERTAADICLCGANSFNAQTGEFYGPSADVLNTGYCPGEIFSWQENKKGIFNASTLAPWNKMYRMEFVRATGLRFQSLPNSNDVFFTMCTLMEASKITYVAKCLLNRRWSNPHSTQGRSHKNPECFLRAYQAVRQWLKQKGYYEAVRECFENLAYNVGRNYHLKRFNRELPDKEFEKICAEFDAVNESLGVPLKQEKKSVYKHKISVIIPVYNADKHIGQCVDSILGQNFEGVEIIIIDDASTDKSYEIAASEYEILPNVKLLKNKKSHGVSRARNNGIKLAKGKYIFFMDAHDILLPQGLEKMYETAEKHRADIVHASEYYESQSEEIDFDGDIEVESKRDAAYCPFICRMNTHTCGRIREGFVYSQHELLAGTNLYRREFLLERRIMFPEMVSQYDKPFAFACYAATDRIWCHPGAFYLRRNHDSRKKKKDYDVLRSEIESVFAGMRALQAMSAKSIEPLDEQLMAEVKVSFFKQVWPFITAFYTKDTTIESDMAEAVEKGISSSCGNDAFCVSLLLHYAAIGSQHM